MSSSKLIIYSAIAKQLSETPDYENKDSDNNSQNNTKTLEIPLDAHMQKIFWKVEIILDWNNSFLFGSSDKFPTC